MGEFTSNSRVSLRIVGRFMNCTIYINHGNEHPCTRRINVHIHSAFIMTGVGSLQTLTGRWVYIGSNDVIGVSQIFVKTHDKGVTEVSSELAHGLGIVTILVVHKLTRNNLQQSPSLCGHSICTSSGLIS